MSFINLVDVGIEIFPAPLLTIEEMFSEMNSKLVPQFESLKRKHLMIRPSFYLKKKARARPSQSGFHCIPFCTVCNYKHLQN